MTRRSHRTSALGRSRRVATYHVRRFEFPNFTKKRDQRPKEGIRKKLFETRLKSETHSVDVDHSSCVVLKKRRNLRTIILKTSRVETFDHAVESGFVSKKSYNFFFLLRRSHFVRICTRRRSNR